MWRPLSESCDGVGYYELASKLPPTPVKHGARRQEAWVPYTERERRAGLTAPAPKSQTQVQKEAEEQQRRSQIVIERQSGVPGPPRSTFHAGGKADRKRSDPEDARVAAESVSRERQPLRSDTVNLAMPGRYRDGYPNDTRHQQGRRGKNTHATTSVRAHVSIIRSKHKASATMSLSEMLGAATATTGGRRTAMPPSDGHRWQSSQVRKQRTSVDRLGRGVSDPATDVRANHAARHPRNGRGSAGAIEVRAPVPPPADARFVQRPRTVARGGSWSRNGRPRHSVQPSALDRVSAAAGVAPMTPSSPLVVPSLPYDANTPHSSAVLSPSSAAAKDDGFRSSGVRRAPHHRGGAHHGDHPTNPVQTRSAARPTGWTSVRSKKSNERRDTWSSTLDRTSYYDYTAAAESARLLGLIVGAATRAAPPIVELSTAGGVSTGYTSRPRRPALRTTPRRTGAAEKHAVRAAGGVVGEAMSRSGVSAATPPSDLSPSHGWSRTSVAMTASQQLPVGSPPRVDREELGGHGVSAHRVEPPMPTQGELQARNRHRQQQSSIMAVRQRRAQRKQLQQSSDVHTSTLPVRQARPGEVAVPVPGGGVVMIETAGIDGGYGLMEGVSAGVRGPAIVSSGSTFVKRPPTAHASPRRASLARERRLSTSHGVTMDHGSARHLTLAANRAVSPARLRARDTAAAPAPSLQRYTPRPVTALSQSKQQVLPRAAAGTPAPFRTLPRSSIQGRKSARLVVAGVPSRSHPRPATAMSRPAKLRSEGTRRLSAGTAWRLAEARKHARYPTPTPVPTGASQPPSLSARRAPSLRSTRKAGDRGSLLKAATPAPARSPRDGYMPAPRTDDIGQRTERGNGSEVASLVAASVPSRARQPATGAAVSSHPTSPASSQSLPPGVTPVGGQAKDTSMAPRHGHGDANEAGMEQAAVASLLQVSSRQSEGSATHDPERR